MHTEIEAEAAPALGAIGRAQQAVLDDDEGALEAHLATVEVATRSMVATLRRMSEGNSPDVFYRLFRPYIIFFADVEYEGVAELAGQRHSPRGETGAQSSIMPALDVALGVRHIPTGMVDHIREMRRYMPRGHRAFVEAIEGGPPIRSYVAAVGDRGLVDVYNACLENVASFRDQHFQ